VSRRAAAVGVAAFVAVASAVALGIALERGGGWTPALELWLARASGWVALGALLAALLATPVGRVAVILRPGGPVARAAPVVRRASGIAAAVLAIAHAAVALGGWLDGTWEAVWSWPSLRAGLLALLVLVALLVTSFPRAVRALRVRLWKPLHRLSYAAAALVVLHLVLSPFVERAAVVVVAGALVAGGLVRLLTLRPGRARARSPGRS